MKKIHQYNENTKAMPNLAKQMHRAITRNTEMFPERKLLYMWKTKINLDMMQQATSQECQTHTAFGTAKEVHEQHP